MLTELPPLNVYQFPLSVDLKELVSEQYVTCSDCKNVLVTWASPDNISCNKKKGTYCICEQQKPKSADMFTV